MCRSVQSLESQYADCRCGYFCCCRVIVVSVSAATAGSFIAHGRLLLLTPPPLALSKLVLRLSCHRRCTSLCLSRGHCCYRCAEVVFALPPLPLFCRFRSRCRYCCCRGLLLRPSSSLPWSLACWSQLVFGLRLGGRAALAKSYLVFSWRSNNSLTLSLQY